MLFDVVVDVVVVVCVDVVDVVDVVGVVVVGITACNNMCVFKLFKICIETNKRTSPARGARLLEICVSPKPNTSFQNMPPV